MVDYCWLLKRDGRQLESITRETCNSFHLPRKQNYLLDLNRILTRDVEAVYLQTASASTPIASASKKITEILLVKYDQCRGS